jgi:hypothetical protein
MKTVKNDPFNGGYVSPADSISFTGAMTALVSILGNPTKKKLIGATIGLGVGLLAGKKFLGRNRHAREVAEAGTYIGRNIRQHNASLADLANVLNLDPVGIISDDLKNYDNTEIIANLALNLFTGYIMRSLPILGAHGKAIIHIMRKIKPGLSMSLETIDETTPVLSQFGLPTGVVMSQERFVASRVNEKKRADFGDIVVGKQIEIEISVETRDANNNLATKEIKLPVQTMLSMVYAPYDAVKMLGSNKTGRDSWFERWVRFRAGTLPLSKLLLQGDIISKNIRKGVTDHGKLYRELHSRKTRAKLNTAAGGSVLYGAGSNVAILSLNHIEKLERELHFDVTHARKREAFMSDLGAIVLIILEKEDDFLTIYYRGMKLPTEISVAAVKRMLRTAKDEKLSEILQHLAMNRSVQL